MAPPSAADFSSLTSAISALTTTMAASAGATGGAADAAAATTTSATRKSLINRIDTVNRTVSNLHTGLEKFTSSLEKTQKQFGVDIGKSAEIQIAGLEASIRSYINSFKSLDFTGLGDAAGSLLAGNFKEFETKLKQTREGIKPVELPFDSTQYREALAEIQKEFGVINKQTAENIAQVARQKGVTAQALVAARRVFATQTLGDLNKVNNLQNKFLTIFEQKGLSAKVALESIAKYSELLARNGTRFATSFTRAAADAKKIGVDLSKIDQIGDSIISDFEGFLEKQAELGAMGFNFDSSKIAELAESGDTGALFTELRSELAGMGKDITKLRRSERLALEGAFGINISELQRMSGATPEEKTTEELTADSNSLLSNILTAIILFSGTLVAISATLTTISGLLGVGGAIASALAFLTPVGLIGAAILAIAGLVAFFTAESFEKTKKLKEEAKAAAITGDYAGATSKIGEAQMSETMSNLGMMDAEAAPIASWMASKERDFQQQQINNIYRLQKLSPGNIGPVNPYREMESGIDRLPQFAPRAVAGDRYNQRLADETVLRGRALTSPIQRAAGGLVTGPGTGKSDSISARLSNGEFVINADMVKKLGLSFLNKLNSGVKVPAIPTGIAKAQELKAGGMGNLFSMAQNKFGNMFGGKAGGAVAKAQELKAGGMGNLFSMAQDKLGGLFGGKASRAMSGVSNLLGSESPIGGMMGLASKIPGVGGLLGKATGLLSGGGLKGMAGSLLGKVGLGSLGGSLLGGPATMLGSLAAPLLKKIPFIGGAASALAGGPSKLLGKLGGSALGKIGGLFGKKKESVANMLPPQMQAVLSGGQPGMEGVNFSAMLSQIMGSRQQQQQSPPAAAPEIDTRGIEQKLNNFITALQGIQINMDGAQVGKVLVNFSDVAGTTGILRPRTSATF